MIDDGTSWTSNLPLTKALRARDELTAGYSDPKLEAKRLAAIRWLRLNGLWIVDRIIRRKT